MSATHRTAVLNVVGLTQRMLGPLTPRLTAFARAGSQGRIDPELPAVTCSAQATYLTGLRPSQHGIVGNGWYDREFAQVVFWKQSNQLVRGEKVWETARRRHPGFTAANLFWWFNMYSSVDWSVTPRPIYPADGRKIPEIYAAPFALGERLVAELGAFPFFSFWGPAADHKSSAWIAQAARLTAQWHSPDLLLVYLPHLDYNLQRLGTNTSAIDQDIRTIDQICGDLIDDLHNAGYRVLVVSEYGLTDVSGPVHINRILRQAGLLRVRRELGLDMLDPGASDAFAVADHQVAHVYVRSPAVRTEVARLLGSVPGIASVIEGPALEAMGLAHPRTGDLVAWAAPDSWFTYYYWLDDRLAPDFARTVDIHRKPGYDPAELFLDPAIRWPKATIAWYLAKKAAGLRTLMQVIPLDASLVRGSHGLRPATAADAPVWISSLRHEAADPLPAPAVRDTILAHLFSS